jgi:predicted metal-binding membrane protein
MSTLLRSRTTVLLLGGAAVAWAVTVELTGGMMDADLGSLEWYFGVWVTMTAAMMLPTTVPAAQLAQVSRAAPTLLFAVGYLAVWAVFGLAAYGAFRHELDSPLAGAVVVAAGIYELTPWKQRSLHRCRSQHEPTSAFRSGLVHGLDCVGCSGGLMLALFAVGVMNLLGMAVVAAVIFAEKVLPHGPRLSRLVAIALIALGIWVAA